MDYKKICNEQLNELSIELMNNGMPMPDVASLIMRLCDTAKSFLEDKKCTK